jgi:multidrug efflux pump subunit AcrA (membrane-fusion protein)
VSIIVKQLSNVLTVPTAALHSSGGKTYVYQEKDGQQVSTEVTVGTTYGNSTQITKGLASGDQVVVTTVTPARTASGGSSSGGNGGGFGGTGGPPAGAGGPVGGSNG